MKFIISAVILFSLLQISTQFAFRNDFEDDDIVEVYERHARDTAATDTTLIAEQSKEIIESSGEEVQ
uniref:Secreted protein n=1 Tax=Panagrolaimus davidi TaxID=227884 RepID=A0A914QK87_9BILA